MKKIFLLIALILMNSCSKDPVTHTLFTSSNPINGGSVSPSKAEFSNGESAEITASASSEYVFKNWTGASGIDSKTSVLMDMDKLVTANFIKKYGYKKEFVKKQDVIKILNFAYKKKILEIDTAFDYDEFNKVKQDINLTKFKISTKCKFKKTDIKKNFFNSKYFRLIKNKLHKLNISNFENFFIHNFDELNKSEANKVLMLLNSFKSLNYIRNVGISLYEKKSLKNITNFKSLDIFNAPNLGTGATAVTVANLFFFL